MTALNLIVQPQAAFLLTDTATFEDDGSVARFTSKVFVVEAERGFSAAIGTSGIAYFGELLRIEVRALRCASVPDFLAALPAAFRKAEQRSVRGLATIGAALCTQAVALAIFDHTTGRSAGYGISTAAGFFPTHGAGGVGVGSPSRPRHLVSASKYLTDWVGDPFPQGADVRDPTAWSPVRDGAALIEAQRADPFSAGGIGYCGVGGHAMLTTVGASGVDQRMLRSWPDRKGSRIDPANNAEPGFWWKALHPVPAMPRVRLAA